VYLHEMPGGQFTNLKAQARSMGLEERWHEVAETYAEVNRMFGDIVKVTPSSKVVGDMALMMVAQGLTRAQVEDPGVDVAFPESVVDMMRGNLGQPPGGWPEALQRKVLKGENPMTARPGEVMPAADLDKLRAELKAQAGEVPVDDEDFCGYLMYPKVFTDYLHRHQDYGPVRTLPTPVYFYGMQPGQEISAEIDPGKTIEVRLQAVGETNAEGDVRVFFELNGQPRTVRVPDRRVQAIAPKRPKAEAGNPGHVAAPMPGVIASVAVTEGQPVHAGDLILTIEAMKMETGLYADRPGVVQALHVQPGAQVDAKDLLVEIAPD
jgi:pyruvate carboxylase